MPKSLILDAFPMGQKIENRAVERQRVEKVASARRRRQVSGREGPPSGLKVRPFDRKSIHKGSRRTVGPKARRINYGMTFSHNLFLDTF